jgi:hypothetical protein
MYGLFLLLLFLAYDRNVFANKIARRVQSSGFSGTNMFQTNKHILGSGAKQHSVVYHGSTAKQYHGSTAKQYHGSGAKQHSALYHGSTAKQYHGSTAYHSSTHGSGAQHHSAAHYSSTHGSRGNSQHNFKGSGPKHQSIAYRGSTHGSRSQQHSALYHGSTALKSKGSGAEKYGSGKNKNSMQYNIFTPTRAPTEALPPVYQPPNPTYNPTLSIKIPEMPISFKEVNAGISVPEIPLTFQIEQGTNGWATYPNTPPVTNAFQNTVVKITGLSNSNILNMHIKDKKYNRRMLKTSITFIYNITVSPEKINEKTQDKAYIKLVNILSDSIKNRTFNNELRSEGLFLNTTTIQFSLYTILYPESNAIISSNGNTKQESVSSTITISVLSVLALAGGGAFAFYIYKRMRNKENKTETVTELTRSPIIKQSVDVIPRRL